MIDPVWHGVWRLTPDYVGDFVTDTAPHMCYTGINLVINIDEERTYGNEYGYD